MKKLDNFCSCLKTLKGADYKIAQNDEIYRRGIIWQFYLSFELAWKALKEVLKQHGVYVSEIETPLEVLQTGYKYHFIDDEEVWLLMLKKRNLSVHVYNEEEIDEMLILIRDSFIPVLDELAQTLTKKLAETEES